MVEKLKESYAKELKKANYHIEELKESINTDDRDEMKMAYEKMSKIHRNLDTVSTEIKDAMLDGDQPLEEVRLWAQESKAQLRPIREFKCELSERLEDLERRVSREKEDESYRRKMDFELELIKKKNEEQQSKPQSVKLQKYTITPFKGDCRDWLRFWNQFQVEVDDSTIPDISKFNYLLELVQGVPKEHILGLPHSPEGYKEAKKVLEMTYGKDNQVHKALIKDLESLPAITNINKVKEVHDFYTKLSRTVRTLTTMKKLESSQAFAYTILDKLGPVKEVIIQKDDEWENWRLEDVVEHLRRYTDRNPLQTTNTESVSTHKRSTTDHSESRRREKVMLASPPTQQSFPVKACVYCDSTSHKPKDCTKVLEIARRREILKKKRLCYNCTKAGHAASECKSRACTRCNGKHHTSLCDKVPATLDPSTGSDPKPARDRFYSALDVPTSLHSTVVAKVNGIPARIMLDSGASSSYISSNLLTELNIKPVHSERRVIEQMYGTIDKTVEVYKVTVESEQFIMDLRCINAEKPTLTFLPNPNIPVLKSKYSHLKTIAFSDEDSVQENLPVHVILGVADVQRIKTTTGPVLGKDPDKEPGAELTRLGWTIAGRSTVNTVSTEKHFFITSSTDEFKQMCSQEVFGLADPVEQDLCNEKFEEQISRLEDGSYSTKLPWKPDHPPLQEHKNLALARLRSTTRKLDNLEKLGEYHTIMQQQLDEGIIEPTPPIPTGNIVHYVPHQPVIREDAESTKLRIVYDCSAKAKLLEPSLNDCLEVGPSLQPMIFDILLKNRTRPYCIAGDIQKAFLQIHVDTEDRDALRLVWYDNLEDRNIVEYRFTRVIFGSGPSPYILGATLHKHVSQYSSIYPDTVKELLTNTYVDDVQSGGESIEQLSKFKEEATVIMEEGNFHLHKWNSNAKEVEGQQHLLNNNPSHEFKILGVPWDKQDDTLAVSFSTCIQQSDKGTVTKRRMLSSINQVFDLLGLASPVLITAKRIYSVVCLKKLKWDEAVPEDEKRRWERWLQALRDYPVIKVPRSVVSTNLVKITLHGFSDASKWAVAAAIYVLTYYKDSSVGQNLLVAKSRIAPKDQTIPRLELIAAHTLSRLMDHVKITLKEQPITEYHGWVDSTTVLHWIEGKGTWSRFVRNRTTDIKGKEYLQWHYVPTEENPSDVGSRGTAPRKLSEVWLKGPAWLPYPQSWPEQPDIGETSDTQKEAVQSKVEKQLLAKEDVTEKDNLDLLLQNTSSYWKLLRVTALVQRFVKNCRGAKLVGVLSTEEIQEAEKFWFRRAQADEKLESNLMLQKDADGIMRCHGRVPNYNPVFLPRNHPPAVLIIKQNHKKTLHGGVSLTMHQVREQIWIPKLRGLVKKIVHVCSVCKRYRAKPLNGSTTSALPESRVVMSEPFTTTGVDYAGPEYYKLKSKSRCKAYIALFTCASTRAVHLKLCHNLTALEFQRALKEFVARRGCPTTIISDNGKTFVATGKWLKLLKKDQSIANYLASLNIKWKFNLSRAPWWGGFFERLIGIMKRALSKVIGRSLLSFQELEEVIIDVENVMNNRPLMYLEEEFEQPVITPNTLLRGRPNPVLEEDIENLDEEKEITKRVKFIQKTKSDLRKRFVKEYVHALEERPPRLCEDAKTVPKTGAVVLLKGDVKHRAQWKLGRVVSQVIGKDNHVRGLKIKLGNGYLIERPLQLVCPLEVGGEDESYGIPVREENIVRVQPKRKTKNAALQMFKDIAQQDNKEDY